jgi:hypothetical protein
VINGQKLYKNLLPFPKDVAKFKNLQVGSEVEVEEFSYLLPITYITYITYYLLPIHDGEDHSAEGGTDGDCN